jgi:hypothetical protein
LAYRPIELGAQLRETRVEVLRSITNENALSRFVHVLRCTLRSDQDDADFEDIGDRVGPGLGQTRLPTRGLELVAWVTGGMAHFEEFVISPSQDF